MSDEVDPRADTDDKTTEQDSGNDKKNEEISKEIEEIIESLPSRIIETKSQVRFSEEARAQRKMRAIDYRFQLSCILVIGYLILLFVPLYRSEEPLLKTIAATLSGPVGAVLGYYFGVRKKEEEEEE